MLESVIISTLAGSFVCTALLIFKNRILAILGGKALYYLSLGAMLIFMLPLNIGDISLPKTTAVGITEFSANETAPPAVIEKAVSEEALTLQATPPPQTEIHPKAPDIVRRSNPVTIQEILIAVWLTGFMLSLGRYFISYFRFKKRICGFEVYKSVGRVRIITSPLITSPMIFGFFKPTLAVPQCEMNESDYQLAIRHEMMHYCHHDSWFKLFAVFVNSLCWFNPITYLMVNLIGEACEYACDEAVVKEMDADGRKQYSEMILSMVCQSSPALSSNMAKSKQQLKRRFEMIMKKKKSGVFKSLLCTAMMLSVLCGGVVLANETAPLVSSLIKDDYVYISNYGNHNYNEFVPVEKDGVYYLPLREFLNKSDIENDKIKYDNGKITIDIWSNTYKMINMSTSENNENTKRTETTIQGKLAWTTSCTIGSNDVFLEGKQYTLKNYPYIEADITYVPYEYLLLLKNYEETRERKDLNDRTHKFIGVIMYGYNSLESEYYCDDAEISSLPREKIIDEDALVVTGAYYSSNADISLKKTGYRTEFSATLDYTDMNNLKDTGNIEIILNKVTRIYSKGSDIEGLFTLKIDGETIYNNKIGYITGLPLPAGEGIIHYGETMVTIGQASLRIYFSGFGKNTSAEYDALVTKNGRIANKSDTKKLSLLPTEVKLKETLVANTLKDNYFQYNIQEEYADIGLRFNYYPDNNHSWRHDYFITRNENSKINVIDENTFSGHFYFAKNETRMDSFDAIITLLPDNRFELKSTDGNYIVRGTVKEFVPQWQWSEEEKNAPVPQVKMINE